MLQLSVQLICFGGFGCVVFILSLELPSHKSPTLSPWMTWYVPTIMTQMRMRSTTGSSCPTLIAAALTARPWANPVLAWTASTICPSPPSCPTPLTGTSVLSSTEPELCSHNIWFIINPCPSSLKSGVYGEGEPSGEKIWWFTSNQSVLTVWTPTSCSSTQHAAQTQPQWW